MQVSSMKSLPIPVQPLSAPECRPRSVPYLAATLVAHSGLRIKRARQRWGGRPLSEEGLLKTIGRRSETMLFCDVRVRADPVEAGPAEAAVVSKLRLVQYGNGAIESLTPASCL